MKFSVITPSYNQGKFIEATIQSVLAQSYPEFEHIVMDGGSSDNTIEILKKYPHLTWSSENDRGQGHALNKAIAMAKGEIIAWLNSDDLYLPGTFETVARSMENHEIVYGDFIDSDENGKIIREFKAPPELTKTDLIRWWHSDKFIGQPATFFRKSVVDEIGKIDENLYFSMDLDFWIRCAEKYQFHYVPQQFAQRCRHTNSKTVDLREKLFRESIGMSKRHWGSKLKLEYYRHWLSLLKFRPKLFADLANSYLDRNRSKSLKYSLLSMATCPSNAFRHRTLSTLLRTLFGNSNIERIKSWL